MKNSISLLAILALLFTIVSCDTSPEFVSGQFDDVKKLISDSDTYDASYFVNEEEVKIIVEDLANTSDNRDDEYPAIDFLSIRVDMNNNNLPDNNVDKSYGISSNDTPCMQYVLLDGAGGTGCIEEVGFQYKASFSSSEKSSEDHVIYEFIIRRENIFTDSDTVGLIFVMSGNDAGGSVPFLYSPLFKETIEFSL